MQTQPEDTTAGRILDPAPMIIVVDPAGNLIISDVPVSVTLDPPGGLAGTTAVASVDGVATFNDIAIFKTGNFRLVFSMGALGAGLELRSSLVKITASLDSVGCKSPTACKVIVEEFPARSGTVAGEVQTLNPQP
ncbi:hypothetical protein T484DRAFT_2104515 [Baffinella frigidus]|nr:hypothetical protein T484DRAFT_2104515 [Cryptophyta sp. CCMP2293]